MASQFPAFIAHAGPGGSSDPYVFEGRVAIADVSQAGEFVVWSAGTISECGANPASILGIILGEAAASKKQLANNKPQPYKSTSTYTLVPIAVLSPDTIVGLSSSTVPVEATHRYNTYGITLLTVNSFWNYWQLDISKTGANARALVVDIDSTNGIFYVRFLPANLQGQSTVS